MKLKLVLLYLFVISVSFAFTAFFLDKNLEENSLANIQSSLLAQSYAVQNQVNPESLQKEDFASLDKLAKTLSPKIKSRVTIINKDGRVLADSEQSRQETLKMENHLYRPEVARAMAGDAGTDTRYSHTLKIDMLYLALPVLENGRAIGVVRLALPLESVQGTLSTIRKTVFLGLLFALGLAFILSYIAASGIVKPVNRIIQVARKFSQGDFSRRIVNYPGDEIGELSRTLNQMAQEIEDKIREIGAQNQELAAIFNSMIEGIIVVDRGSRVVSINPAIEKIFNISKGGAQGKPLLEAIRNNEISEVMNSVLANGRIFSAEITLLLPVRRIFEVNATPIFENGGVNGCLAVIHDITEIRRLETVRRDFVANVSHELKTPLTSIKGFVETLLEGALDDKENNRNFLKIIQDHAGRLDSLVNDLLSLSHLESKEIMLKKTSFNLRQQVEDIIGGFRSQLKNKGIAAKNDLPAGISVTADKDRLEQVVTNLIDNAIKFNKEKGSLRVFSEEIKGGVKIIVEDSGIGIPEKDLPRIFERFYRVDKARSRELGGTGLGLSIVKHIVELHQGSVGVTSTEGLGSRFFFTLPA